MDQLSLFKDREQPASPIRRQYLDIKSRYPDAILLFGLGDFYETFDDDARVLASELEIALTGREMGKGERVPLAGIPYHAAEGYIARLIAKGYRIAVCDQLGTTAVRGLVPREVVRVITPGTLIEEALLPCRANNYLAAVVPVPEGVGFAFVDISTGDFAATEIAGAGWGDQLGAELARTRPAECLLPRGQTENPDLRASIPLGCYVTPRDESTFSSNTAERTLKEHFRVATLDGFDLPSAPLAARAAGGLLAYLRETQPTSALQLESLTTYRLDRFMRLDASARRHLEIAANAVTGALEGSLLGVLDRTRTPMGSRLLRQWIGQPLMDLDALQLRLNAVEEMVRSPLGRAEVGEVLSGVGDLERLASRAAQQTVTPRDCLAVAKALRCLPRLHSALRRWLPDTGQAMAGELEGCDEAVTAIERTVSDAPAATIGDGAIRSGRSAELDELRTLTGDTRQWIARLERTERERTGIRSLKIGFNKVFGYYIEVTTSNLEAPTDEYARLKTGASTVSGLLEALGYQRKQTIANGERFVTAQLKEQELRLQNAQAEIEALEKQIYAELLAELSAQAQRIRKTAHGMARLDAHFSMAEAAVSGRYVRPILDQSTSLSIRAGRHPMVERFMAAGEFVPNDCHLSTDSEQIAVLTGPNMAGKSTYVLGVALVVLMAQIGSFVPAEEAHIGLVDRIFTRVGAQHDVSSGKSTFLVEMAETANVLHNATPRSLVVLDEVGRGTSTYDGMAIARAVIEYLHEETRLRCKTLFATHFHELTELEGLLPRVRNLRMDVLEEGDKVVFLHRVVAGGADRSFGIHVAQLAGMPPPVVRRSRQILNDLEARRLSPAPAAGTVTSFERHEAPEVEAMILAADVSSMTPLQAIEMLYELQKRLRSSGLSGRADGNPDT